MVALHRRSTAHAYGVEPICRHVADRPVDVLPAQGPAGGSDATVARARSAMTCCTAIIQRIWDEHDQVVRRPRKVWRQMGREGLRVARCRVRRLMRELGLRRRRARAGVDHDDAVRRDGRAPARSGRAALHRDASESALGLGLHVRRHVARLRLRGLRHRRLRAPHRRLARVGVAADRLRARCARAGDLRPLWDDTVGDLVHHSDRGTPVSVDALHRAAGRRRHRAVGRQPRRLRTTTPSPSR